MVKKNAIPFLLLYVMGWDHDQMHLRALKQPAKLYVKQYAFGKNIQMPLQITCSGS